MRAGPIYLVIAPNSIVIFVAMLFSPMRDEWVCVGELGPKPYTIEKDP